MFDSDFFWSTGSTGNNSPPQWLDTSHGMTSSISGLQFRVLYKKAGEVFMWQLQTKFASNDWQNVPFVKDEDNAPTGY